MKYLKDHPLIGSEGRYKVEEAKELLAKITPWPWAQHRQFKNKVVPAGQEILPLGGAIDPVRDRDFAQPIAHAPVNHFVRDDPEAWSHRHDTEGEAIDNIAFIAAAPRLVDELVREVERLESVVTELQPINNAEVSALRVALTEMTAKFRACAIHVGSDPEFVDAAIEAICGAACPVHQM